MMQMEKTIKKGYKVPFRSSKLTQKIWSLVEMSEMVSLNVCVHSSKDHLVDTQVNLNFIEKLKQITNSIHKYSLFNLKPLKNQKIVEI